jgi:hypothetical protein
MNLGILLAMTLLPAQLGPSAGPTPSGPLSNTFITAAETVIDNSATVDLKADDVPFDAQLQQLKSSRDNLSTMAVDSRQKDIAGAANHLVFLVSACHIQAKNGADTTKCESQLVNARKRMMDSIGKHKNGDSWTDGPPS